MSARETQSAGSQARVHPTPAPLAAPRPFEVTYPGQETAASPTNPFPSRPHEAWRAEAAPPAAQAPGAFEEFSSEAQGLDLDWSGVSLYAAAPPPTDPPPGDNTEAKSAPQKPFEEDSQPARAETPTRSTTPPPSVDLFTYTPQRQSVGLTLQPKLTIEAANDPYEQAESLQRMAQPEPRSEFESLSQEFGSVFGLQPEVDTSPAGVGIAQSLGTIAAVKDNTIHVDPAQVNPSTDQGRNVIAHEVVHLAQARLSYEPSNEGDIEGEAHAVGNRLATGKGASPIYAARDGSRLATWHPPGSPPPETELSPDGFLIEGRHIRVERLWYEQHYRSHRVEANRLILQRLSESSMPWITEVPEAMLARAARNIELSVPNFEQRDVQTVPIFNDVCVWVGLPPGTNVLWEFPRSSQPAPTPPADPASATTTTPPPEASTATLRAARLLVRASEIEAVSGHPTISPPLLTEILDRLEAQVGAPLLPGIRETAIAEGHLGDPASLELAGLYHFQRPEMIRIFGEAAWLAFEQRTNESGHFASGEAAAGNVTVDPGIPNEEQHFARRMLEELFGGQEGGALGPVRLTASLVAVLHQIDAHPQRSRIVQSLRNASTATAASEELSSSLLRAMQTIDMQTEYERLNITPGSEPAQERAFPWPVQGRIINHTDLLFAGKEAAFSVDIRSRETPPLMVTVPWVNVHWVVRETSHQETSARRIEDGHTSHRDRLDPPERFTLSFDHPGTYEINAIVDHDLFALNHFTIFVEVRTEQERFQEVQERAYSSSLWGEVDDDSRITDHEFLGITDVSWDTGTVYEGEMVRECGPGMPPVPRHLDALERRITEVEAYIASGRVDANGREWATEYLAAMQQVRTEIQGELEGGAQLVYIQAAYLSRGEAATSQPLQLVAHARRLGGLWQFTIHDTTQAFDHRNSEFQMLGETYRQAVEATFTELCKSYPKGLMSARIELLDDVTRRPTGRYVGFELDCTSSWEAVRSVAYHPVVSGIINIAGTVATLFIPAAAPFIIPTLIAYNAVDTIGTMVDLSARGAFTTRDAVVGTAQLAIDLIPYVGRATRVMRIGTKTYQVMEGLESAGEIVLMTAQAQEEVQTIRMGVVRQAAEVHAQIRDLETNNPSDPELPRLREEFGRLQAQANEAWETVGRDITAQQLVMRAPVHVMHGIHQRQVERVEHSRQTLTDAMSSRGGERIQAADRAHVARVMGVRIERLVPGGDVGRGDVRIAYDVSIFGGITNVRLQVGPDASLNMVMHHERTLAAMRRYEGITGSLHNLLARVQAWVQGGGHIPPGTRAFEARFELQKLPPIIQSLRQELTSQSLTDTTRNRIEAQIASLERQLETHAAAFNDLAEGLGYVAARDDTTDGPVSSEGGDPRATMGRQPSEVQDQIEQQRTQSSHRRASEPITQAEITALRERLQALGRRPGASRAARQALSNLDTILARPDLTPAERRMMLHALEEFVTWRRAATRDQPMETVEMADGAISHCFEAALEQATLDGNADWQVYSQLVRDRYYAQGTLEIGRSPRTTDPRAVADTNRMRADFIAAMTDQSALPEAIRMVQDHLERAVAAHGSEAAAVAAGDAVWIDPQNGTHLEESNPDAVLWPADPAWGVWRVDHVVEIQHGGADDISNYFPVSQRMHAVKSEAMNEFGRMVREQGLTVGTAEEYP